MKITFNFISILLIITLCTTMCLLGGCNSVVDNNISSNNDISYGEVVEGSTSEITTTEDSEVIDETTNDSNESDVATGNAVENEVASNNSTVSSSVVSETTSEPTNTTSNNSVVSTPSDTSSEDAVSVESTPSVDTSKPTDALIETPTYPTIQLEVPTTYYGYSGYFTLSDSRSDIHLVESGLGTDNSMAAMASTEYFDITTGSSVFFIFEGTIVEYKDLLYNHIYVVGLASTKVNAIY